MKINALIALILILFLHGGRALGHESYDAAKARTLKELANQTITTPGLDPANIPSFQTLADIPRNPPQRGHLYSSQKFSNRPIIFMSFENGIIQGLAFDRLYAFVESKNKGKISNDKIVSTLMGKENPSVEGSDSSGGHDYKSADIARFFSRAQAKKFPLNLVEKKLLADLLSGKLLVKTAEGYQASGDFALIGTSQHVTAFDRDHEFNHGVYFTDGRYRAAAENLWKSLPADEKNLVNKVMSSFKMYDFKNDRDLFLREFMAFFRAPKGLEDFYLPSGFDQKLTPKLELIAKKVKGTDTVSIFYQEMLQSSSGVFQAQFVR